MSCRPIARQRGFTLLEVMVALVIVSLGMTAVYLQIGQFASNAIYLRDKTLASWIGSNTVTELSIGSEWPDLGDDELEVEYAGRLWEVRIEISETGIDNLRRADVDVALSEQPDRVVHRVSALIEPPVPAGFPPVSWRSVGQGQVIGQGRAIGRDEAEQAIDPAFPDAGIGPR